jgi:hypothetical protein
MITIPYRGDSSNLGWYGMVIDGFTIRNGTNTSSAQAAGILCWTAGVTISNNIIENNSASNGYGGVHIYRNYGDSSRIPLVQRNLIRNNTGAYLGGLLLEGGPDDSWGYADARFENNLIVNNTANPPGGSTWGIGGFDTLSTSNVTILNSTIANNTVNGTPTNKIPGLRLSDGNVTITNSIIWHPSGYDLWIDYATYSINYSNIEDQGFSGTGVIHQNPGFVGATDYHLSPASPCVDTGNNGAIPGGMTLDYYGNPRISDGNRDGNAVVDMGGNEFLADSPSAPGDFDGDGSTDVVAFHHPTDQFFTDYAGNLGQYGWGGADCYPLIWDYDGDGITEVSIYHIPTNQWFVNGYSGDNMGQFGWDQEDCIPVPGDYNGDGTMERAFYHTPSNTFFVEGQGGVTQIQFGWNGSECIPVPGDYDGDGITDLMIYHLPTNQWLMYGVGNLGQYGWNGPECIPVPGDYDGDGSTDIAVYHYPTNQWFVKGYPEDNLGQYGWGGMESFPIPGDYDGDGTVERGFYRHAENWWFIEGQSDFTWGWGGQEFMPITSQINVFNWFRFVLNRFQ